MKTNEALNFILDKLNVPPSDVPDFNEIRNVITDLQYEGELLYKLENDGYVRKKHNHIITVEGRLFIEDGGYVKKSERDTILLQEKKDRLRRMERNEVLLVIGTFLFVLVEILVHWKELLSLLCHYH